jgi:hypothetical protein
MSRAVADASATTRRSLPPPLPNFASMETATVCCGPLDGNILVEFRMVAGELDTASRSWRCGSPELPSGARRCTACQHQPGLDRTNALASVQCVDHEFGVDERPVTRTQI